MSLWVSFARISVSSSISLLLLVLVSSWTWKLLLKRTQSMDCKRQVILFACCSSVLGGRLRAREVGIEKALHIVLVGHARCLNLFGFTHIPLIQRQFDQLNVSCPSPSVLQQMLRPRNFPSCFSPASGPRNVKVNSYTHFSFAKKMPKPLRGPTHIKSSTCPTTRIPHDG